MPRRQDWPERLSAFIAAREHTPFQWGVQDCCTFAADAALTITDEDPMADLRGYTTAVEAARLLVTPIAELVGARLPAVARGFAQRGDLAIAPQLNDDDRFGRDAVMIVDGDWLIGAGRTGLVRAPRRVAAATFRVG